MVTLLLLVALLSSSTSPVEGVCSRHAVENCSKPWFVWYNDTCKCGCPLNGVISCAKDDYQVNSIKKCNCMTVDDRENAVVGTCPYMCGLIQTWNANGTDLNKHLCKDVWKRNGTLCSKCMDGYGPLVYSYSMQCIPCSPDVVRDSVVLFLMSFLPLTVFCLAIITLRISGARPPMSTFILVSQVMAAPQYLSLIFVPHHNFVSSHYIPHHIHTTCWKLFAAFYGLWNLDIFRSFYPQMCLSPKMSTLQAKCLEYAIALFPLVTLWVVYFCVKLYNRGYKIIFCLCRPLISCLARLRQTVNVQTSLIDAFATFIILSVNKVGYISFIILQPVHVISPKGNYSIYTYIDPTVRYFGWANFPYALTALVLTIVLILIPLLLLFLYPLRSFQTFLNNHHWQCSTLHIFADTFQGCYKNGTNGTRDYRWFAGLHLLMRFVVVCFFDLSNYYKINAVLMVISLSFYMGLLAILQPYKKYIHLKLDMVLLFGLLLWCTALQVSVMQFDSFGTYDFALHLTLLTLAALIPLVFFIGFGLHLILVRKGVECCGMGRRVQVFCCPPESVRLIEHSTL